jgi:UDP-glucose 4-epimerase
LLITEQAPIKKPESPYSNTKKVGEQILIDNSKATNFSNTIALRYFNPIGAHVSAGIWELSIGIPQNLIPFVIQK